MNHQPISAPPPAIDWPLIQRVEDLETTADYITCIVELAGRAAAGLHRLARERADGFGDFGDWKEIQIVLSLAEDQAELVRTTAKHVANVRLGRAA